MTELDDVVAEMAQRVAEAEERVNRAWWELSLTSSDEAAKEKNEAEVALREIFADGDAFAVLSAAHGKPPADPMLARQAERLFLSALTEQIPSDLRRQMVELSTEIEAAFNSYRGSVDGGSVSDNEIDDVLRKSGDETQRKAYWEASKEVGAEVASRIRRLASLRNRAAAELGHRDYRSLMLTTQEFDPVWLDRMLDEIEGATREPFVRWKAGLDDALSARFGTNELRPWHYGDRFFQEAPTEAGIDLDPLFEGADLAALTAATYCDIDIPVDDALARSDLLPRDGKSQHAFCIHIDRRGDVRVLSNNTPGERWMETMLHEFGHAAYDLYHDASLPFLLREPAHIFVTEGVAMLFGRLVHDAPWLRHYAGVAEGEADRVSEGAAAARRAALLVFARWGLVMARFEQRLYSDPFDPGLDDLWWDLVESLQRVRRPDGRSAPDWAAKIHLAVAPVYYHNYLLGELFASQLSQAAGPLAGRPEAGRFLRDRVFSPGCLPRWDRLCADALDAPLSVTAWAEELV